MSLWDADAAGDAAQWLRLPAEEMMEITGVEYKGRNAVWVPYSETGYCKGEVIGDGDKEGVKKVIREADHKEKMIKDSDMEYQNPPKYELLEGMNHLSYDS